VDSRVAVVQLPQEFYNLDSVQHRSGRPSVKAWHEQALFYRVIQTGKNRWNSAFWCGSPSILRRDALMDLGGVVTESLTEDLHTSLRLHARGWKTVYHNERLAYGIAPQTLHAFALQRQRWAQGTMQILRSRDNPLVMRGLSLPQRLNYVASTFTYFEAFQKLVYLALPAVVLVTGILPMRVAPTDFLAHWLPYFALSTLANVALGRGVFNVLLVERYNVLKLFVFMWATTTLVLRRPLTFKVTPKDALQSERAAELRVLAPHLLLTSAVGLSIVIGLLNLNWALTATYQDTGLMAVTMMWAITNTAILLYAVQAVLRRAYNRENYRFPISLRAQIGQAGVGTVEDLSQGGCAVVVREALAIGSRVQVELGWPDGSIALDGVVKHTRMQADGLHRSGIHFLPMEPEVRRRLIAFLFVTVARHQGEAIDLASEADNRLPAAAA
jgi:cellulose synthase (UDP-forming)